LGSLPPPWWRPSSRAKHEQIAVRPISPRTRGHAFARVRHSAVPALLLGLWLLLASSFSVAAASPDSSPVASPAPEPTAGIIDTVDPRSNGQGPGLVGSPFAILLGVVLLGVVAAGGTLLFLRVTRED
jgi:hypothetical protein